MDRDPAADSACRSIIFHGVSRSKCGGRARQPPRRAESSWVRGALDRRADALFQQLASAATVALFVSRRWRGSSEIAHFSSVSNSSGRSISAARDGRPVTHAETRSHVCLLSEERPDGSVGNGAPEPIRVTGELSAIQAILATPQGRPASPGARQSRPFSSESDPVPDRSPSPR